VARRKGIAAAYWVKGCSSLGRLRYAVLLDVDGACQDGGGPCLVDVKEAATAAAPRYAGLRMPRDNAHWKGAREPDDAASRDIWLAELQRNRPKSLDAPSWLWRSVIELTGLHEVACQGHCQRYALDRPLS
jgi:uncharacterized protein (DUF2252 family)